MNGCVMQIPKHNNLNNLVYKLLYLILIYCQQLIGNRNMILFLTEIVASYNLGIDRRKFIDFRIAKNV